VGSRSHAPHPRSPARRPICARPTPIRWSESGRRPLVAGGQGRDAADLTATARDLLRLVGAGLALAGLTYGLGELARVWL